MIGQLGLRTLEQCRTDSRLVLFYKIIYGYVAIHLPSYVIPLTRVSWTSHPLAYRQISTETKYYKYSFYPLRVVQWNSLPVSVATLTDIDSLKRAVCQVCHSKPSTYYTAVFIVTFPFPLYNTLTLCTLKSILTINCFFTACRGNPACYYQLRVYAV